MRAKRGHDTFPQPQHVCTTIQFIVSVFLAVLWWRQHKTVAVASARANCMTGKLMCFMNADYLALNLVSRFQAFRERKKRRETNKRMCRTGSHSRKYPFFSQYISPSRPKERCSRTWTTVQIKKSELRWEKWKVFCWTTHRIAKLSFADRYR